MFKQMELGICIYLQVYFLIKVEVFVWARRGIWTVCMAVLCTYDDLSDEYIEIPHLFIL